MFIVWFGIFDTVFPDSYLNETNMLNGIMIDVDLGTRVRHGVRVRKDGIEVSGILWGQRGGPDYLRENVGEQVTIWYFTEPQWPFFYETRIVEIEIAGETRKNNWNQIRDSKANGLYTFFAILGVIAVLNFGYQLANAVYQDLKNSSGGI